MNLRKLFYRLKKKLKRQPAGGGQDPQSGETSAGGVDWTSSLPQPRPHVIAGGSHDRPQLENGVETDGGQVSPTDPPPHSDDSGFVAINEIEIGHDKGGGETAVEGKGSSSKNFQLGSDVEGVVESGPTREGCGVGGDRVNREGPPPSESTQAARHFSRCL